MEAGKMKVGFLMEVCFLLEGCFSIEAGFLLGVFEMEK